MGEVEAAALCTDVVQVFSVESPKPKVSEAPGFGRFPTFSDVSLMRSAAVITIIHLVQRR